MSVKHRQDFLVVESVTLTEEVTQQFTPVKKDGTIAAANEDAFGVAVDTGDIGDIVAVCRLGFCPVVALTAADISEGDELVVGANGQVDDVPASGGGTTSVIGIAEEDANADGQIFGAWIDCLTYDRSRDIPA